MLIEYLYVVAVGVFLVVCPLLITCLWWGWKHKCYGVVDWMERVLDRVFYYALDTLMGKHETY